MEQTPELKLLSLVIVGLEMETRRRILTELEQSERELLDSPNKDQQDQEVLLAWTKMMNVLRNEDVIPFPL